MLSIRPVQQAVLARMAADLRAEHIQAHLERVWPRECAAMGAPALTSLVDDAIEQCRRYGIVTAYDVGRYADLFFLWSRGFHEDPALPWAREVLCASGFDGRTKVDLLYDRTRAVCDEILRGSRRRDGAEGRWGY